MPGPVSENSMTTRPRSRQRADQQHTAAGGLHGVDAIADQMIENLEQLIRIAADRRQDAAIFEFDADIFFA